jgi:hypothetical protein
MKEEKKLIKAKWEEQDEQEAIMKDRGKKLEQIIHNKEEKRRKKEYDKSNVPGIQGVLNILGLLDPDPT